MTPETFADVESDLFASYFSDWDPSTPPKVLITTSLRAKNATCDCCEELVGVFSGAEFFRRKKRGSGLRGEPQTDDISRCW